MIDPTKNQVSETINFTSFDEDPRPPFQFGTGGVIPSPEAMIQKPLYHGAISLHGCVPSPDSRMFATCGRGSSNLYLIDTTTLRIIGNKANPRATASTTPEILTSGVFVGREPHEPTFTRNGKEIWDTIRGENHVVVLGAEKAITESNGAIPRGSAIRGAIPTVLGPAMTWFTADGKIALVLSQKSSKIDVMSVRYDAAGYSTAEKLSTIDTSGQDPFGFSPFLKLTPDVSEFWVTHKLADAASVYSASEQRLVDVVKLGDRARPNHVEFVRNERASVAYVSLSRLDDGGPGNIASSKIAIIDRSAERGSRRVVGQFFSHGREAHGLWTDPSNTRLYVAHELDELPGASNSGQTVCSVFDVSDPLAPGFITQIPLGYLPLPSGQLRNKKSINLVYVRPGSRSVTA